MKREILQANTSMPKELNKLKKEQFVLRLHQDFTVTKTRALIKSNPELPILWGHIPRSGKSFMIAALIRDYVLKANETKLFAIVCAIPNETKPQYENIFKSYHGFNNIKVINISSIKKPIFKKGKNVLLFSRQFFTNKKDQNKLTWVADEVFEYLFIDEAHYAQSTEKTGVIFTHFFNNATKIYVTATYRKPEAWYGIEKERTIIWRQEDVQLCKTLNKETSRKKLVKFHDKNGGSFFDSTLKRLNEQKTYAKIKEDYEKFPELELITWRIDKEYKKHLANENEEENKKGWSINALFNKKDGKFENPSGIIDIFNRIFGTGSQENKATAFLNRCHKIALNKHKHKKNKNKNSDKLSEVRMRWFTNSDPKLILCFLPMKVRNVFNIRKLSEKLKQLLENNAVCPDFYIKCINSNNSKSARIAVTRAKNKVKNSRKYKGILVLLGRQLQMGISLPKADFVFMLDNGSQYDNIYQKMCRCLTEDKGKNVGFCIDLNIQRILNYATTEMWSDQEASELGADAKKQRSYKFNESRFTSRLININSDQYTDKDNLAINHSNLKAMVARMNKIQSESILNATAVLSKTNSILSPFYRKNEFFVKAAKDSQLLQDLNNIFNKSPTSVESSDSNAPTGLNRLDENDNDSKNVNLGQKKKKQERAKINYARDIFPPLVILMCLLTIRKDKLDDFQNMSDYINKHVEYKQYLLSQINLWWRKDMNAEFNGKTPYTDLVKLYYESFHDTTFNKWISCYKAKLVELHQIDKQNKLSMQIDKTFIPSKREKNDFAAIMTPRELRQKMLDLMPSDFWKSPSNKVFEPCCGKGGFVVDIIERFMKGLAEVIPNKKERYKHIVEKQIYFSDIIQINIWLTRMMLDPSGRGYKLHYSLGDSTKLDIYKKWNIRNFEAIITNPPFNDDSGNFGSAHDIWPEFIQKFIEWLKNYTGLLLTVCPNKWRHLSASLKIKKVKLAIKEYYMLKIVFCGTKTGSQYFNCPTKYDYFLLQKKHRYKETNVIDEQGKSYDINLSKYHVIPNKKIDKYYQLLQFNGGGQK